jgi:hypothetical protein
MVLFGIILTEWHLHTLRRIESYRGMIDVGNLLERDWELVRKAHTFQSQLLALFIDYELCDTESRVRCHLDGPKAPGREAQDTKLGGPIPRRIVA